MYVRDRFKNTHWFHLLCRMLLVALLYVLEVRLCTSNLRQPSTTIHHDTNFGFLDQCTFAVANVCCIHAKFAVANMCVLVIMCLIVFMSCRVLVASKLSCVCVPGLMPCRLLRLVRWDRLYNCVCVFPELATWRLLQRSAPGGMNGIRRR